MTTNRTDPAVVEVHSQLRTNAMGLTGVLMQGIGTIAPAFAIVCCFTGTVGQAGLAAPLAYLIAGAILMTMAVSASELARAFPSAGGWYTWIAKSLHPRAGFFGGWYMTLWLCAAPALLTTFLGKVALTPAIEAGYGVHVPVFVWPVAILGLVAWTAYLGITISIRLLVITGLAELAIMVLLAVTGLLNPGPAGFSFAPWNYANHGKQFFLAVVFSIFAFSGWEGVAPVAEESRDPKRNVPRGLIGSMLMMLAYFGIVIWGYIIGIGTSADKISGAADWPVLTLAHRVWGAAWIFVVIALINSALAATIACFNGGTRTWFGMGRSGSLPAALGTVSRRRRTPDNAIHLMIGVQIVGLILCAVWGAENVFPTWALTITLGLITMYILANIGVVKHFLTDRRDEFRPVVHLVFPIISTVAVLVVAYKSVVPLPDAPFWYAIPLFLAYTALGLAIVVFLAVTGRDAWLAKAQIAADAPEVLVLDLQETSSARSDATV